MLHAIVEHHQPQLWTLRSHLGQAMNSVLANGNMKTWHAALHHPRFVADVLPLLGHANPLKPFSRTAISTAQHPHRVLADHGLKPLCQIQNMRSFASAPELHVAHHQRRKCAALAGQDAPVVQFVSDV